MQATIPFRNGIDHIHSISSIWSINCVDVIYRMLQLPCSEFPNSSLQQPSTLNFQYSKILRNPFPLTWLPWKRAAKLTVFLVKWFKKMMWIRLAAPKPSRCIHDAQHLHCQLKLTPVQSCKDLPCPDIQEGKKFIHVA